MRNLYSCQGARQECKVFLRTLNQHPVDESDDRKAPDTRLGKWNYSYSPYSYYNFQLQHVHWIGIQNIFSYKYDEEADEEKIYIYICKIKKRQFFTFIKGPSKRVRKL